MTTDRATARAQIEQLYAAHHQEIYRYLSRMLRNEELAADLTQETFVKAFRAFDTLTDQARARAWLYQIAINTAINELRRQRIVRFIPWTSESRGSGASAEETALRGRFSAEMERALAALPDRQRQALLLAEVGELNGIELAEALGISHVAARQLLTRARESLRQALAVERARSATEDADVSRREVARRPAGDDRPRRRGRRSGD